MPTGIHQGHGYRNTRRTNIIKHPGEWILFLDRVLTNSGLHNTVCVCCCLLWQRLLLKAYWKKKLSFWLFCKIHFSSEIYNVAMKTNPWSLFLEVWLLFQMERLKDNFANCNYHGILKFWINFAFLRYFTLKGKEVKSAKHLSFTRTLWLPSSHKNKAELRFFCPLKI